MMQHKTPKEEAEDLVSKYLWLQRKFESLAKMDVAKECAIIAVDKIIEVLTQVISPSLHGFLHDHYKEVKQEILKL